METVCEDVSIFEIRRPVPPLLLGSRSFLDRIIENHCHSCIFLRGKKVLLIVRELSKDSNDSKDFQNETEIKASLIILRFSLKPIELKRRFRYYFFFLFPDDTMELIRKRAINFENLNKTERIKKAS